MAPVCQVTIPPNACQSARIAESTCTPGKQYLSCDKLGGGINQSGFTCDLCKAGKLPKARTLDQAVRVVKRIDYRGCAPCRAKMLAKMTGRQ